MAGPNSYSGPLVANAGWASAAQGRLPETDCPKPPACPACGGLECLCRPRFFAGQLLTEDDLNRLEGYVVAKNKLHNRYMHGWGVVCGLEVVCDPCGQGIIVRSGYALAPCGEDIVVCDDQVVDICALIDACRPVYDPCPPMTAPGPTNTGGGVVGTASPCGDVTDRWVLAICYDERPSRGVTPLRPPPACGCGGKGAGCGCGGGGKKANGKAGGCGCGGRGTSSQTVQAGQSSKGCGCGTAGKAAPSRGTYATKGAAAVACEPTLICESYRFVAYKEPSSLQTGNPGISIGPQATTPTADAGALVERVLCCWQALTSRLQRIPANADNATLARWCCDMRAALIDFVTSHPTYACGLADRARALVCPDPNQQDFDQALLAAVLAMAEIAATYLRYCFCQALLPPCPDATDGDCVPLAVVEVRRSDCRAIDVCNWGPRRFALNFPQLAYWASPFHLGELLSNAIEKLCCTFVRASRTIKIPGRQAVLVSGGEMAAAAPVAPAGAPPSPAVAAPVASAATVSDAPPAPENAGQIAARLSFEAFRTPSRQIDAATILLDALGVVSDKDQPLLTPLERASPVSSLVAKQVTQPFGASFLPGVNSGAILAEVLARALGGTPAPVPAPTPSPSPAPTPVPSPGSGAAATGDLAELRRTIAELTRIVAAQGDEIKKLRNRRAPER
jgi:hypothetical protein